MAETGNGAAAAGTYSPAFAFVYVFNLIIGVGALSLPKAFSDAGIILGSILLIVLAFMSYITATLMIEVMATANAYTKHKKRKKQNVVEAMDIPHVQQKYEHVQKDSYTDSGRCSPSWRSPSPSPGSEKTKLIPPIMTEDSDSSDDEMSDDSGKYILPADDYEIKEKFEMGTMANMFYHPIGIILYYIVICLYLYGDLAIYVVAIPKSLVVVTCTKPPNGSDLNDTEKVGSFNGSAICFYNITQLEAYYMFLTVTVFVLCPWTFFNLTKSKYIQLTASIMRNIAFVLLVAIAIIKLAEGHRASPSLANFSGFPVLFGVSIYSFMCQHSLPGTITPMKTKKSIGKLLCVEFALILSFYFVITYTGAFLYPYEALNDLYTLNFFTQFSKDITVLHQALAILGYYLALFPVFTVSSNFPIISITLRENLKALFIQMFKRWRGEEPFHWVINRLVFPFLVIIPAIAIAYGTQNVQLLVSITGAFPGIGVQYVIPVTLAFAGKYAIQKIGLGYDNKHKSPFSYFFFLVLVLAWTAVCIITIIAEDVIKIVQHKFED